MGTYSSDDFESGTRAGLAGGTTMVVDFCLPGPEQSLLEALQMWDNKTSRANADYSFHMAITGWNERVFNEMETVVKDRGINTFKHFMAYKGALMVNDDEMFASFQRCAELGALPLVHAENGDAGLRAIALAKELGAEAGVVLRLETPVSAIEPFIDHVAFVTLLGTSIGVKGQSLSEKACDRLLEARSLLKKAGCEERVILAADGGIREQTVPLLRQAGAQTVVLGSLAFGDKNLGDRIAWLHGLESRVS